MSRGHGRWQRLILEAVRTADDGVVLTSCEDTEAEQVSIRRAAHSLERSGRIALSSEVIDGRRRLVASTPRR